MNIQRFLISLTIINLGLLLFVLAKNGTVTAQDIAPVLRGRALEIVDGRGQVRAQINVEPTVTTQDGNAYPEEVVLRLRDPKGLIRVKLGANQNGSGLTMLDDRQELGVHILAQGAGTFLKLTDKNGREQLIRP